MIYMSLSLEHVDTAALNARFDIRELAAAHTTLRRKTRSGEMEGPCPRCGGHKRFYVNATYFACRDCHERKGDAIAFIEWLHNVPFKEAVKMLDATALPAAAPAAPAPARQATRWQNEQADETCRKFGLMANAACDALRRPGCPGQAYLARRGLTMETADAFRLGYAADAMYGGPAIVMPWYRSGRVYALQYRFLDPKPGHKKNLHETGSTTAGLLYGGHVLPDLHPESTAYASRSLIIVEGELNCASIWQVAYRARVDVLSLGSESAHISPAAVRFALRYRARLVWMDKERNARERAALVDGAAYWNDPDGDTHGPDANDALQNGSLPALVANLLYQATPAAHHEALYYDLKDAGLLVHIQ
jgi:hypothetical protein